jgi:hypothetical protein
MVRPLTLSTAPVSVKLINLFAGVSDEQLDELADFSSNVFSLIRAVLLNPLENVPLAMLIDELQNTPEYQAQTGCYKTWNDLYCKLLSVAEQMSAEYETATEFYKDQFRYGTKYKLAQDIRTFLSPISYMTQSRHPQPEPRNPMRCHACNGHGSINYVPCGTCNTTGFL